MKDSVFEFTDAQLEALARAHHDHYRRTVGMGADAPASLRRWSELSPVQQASNRSSARAAFDYAHALGYRLQPANAGIATKLTLDADEVERLARAEHDRWMADRRRAGWVHGPRRDDDAHPPTHPDLVPWSELNDAAREKDRSRIRDLPAIAATAGLELVPIGDRPASDEAGGRLSDRENEDRVQRWTDPG